MPRLNGLGVLHRVKERSPNTPVLILTGHASLETALDAMRHGAFDYLLKPVEMVDQLQLALDRALLHRTLLIENRRLLDELQMAKAGLEQKVDEQTHELRAAYEKLQGLDRMKSEFVSIVSHELRTPLSVILLSSQILAGEHDRLSPEQRQEHLANLRTYSRRLQRLVENLLDFSLLERGEMQLLRVPVSVTGILHEINKLYAPRASEKGVTLQLVSPQPDVVLQADPDRLSNALNQLVDNAIKFTSQGGRIVIGAHGPTRPPNGSAKPHVVIAVADTGIGIPADRQRLLFQSFTQVDMSDRRRYEGIGLGLALAHRIVAAHGGQLTFKSEAKKGSLFTIWLPIEPK
jgi:signal transduction histidine kinase